MQDYHKKAFDLSGETANQMQLIREEKERKETEAKKEKRWSFVAPQKKGARQPSEGTSPMLRRNMNLIQIPPSPELDIEHTVKYEVLCVTNESLVRW